MRLLLAALVASRGEAVAGDVLIERVWGDRLPVHPERVLRSKLSMLRAALDQAEPGLREQLRHGPAGYTLTPAPGMVDAQRFAALTAQARRMPTAVDRAVTLAEALALWRGPAYADVADELWLLPTIEALQEARLSAVEMRSEALLESGGPTPALDLVTAETVQHPMRERLVGAQMLALYQLGRQDDALGAYDMLRRRLAEELGADPTPASRELHARILRQDSALTVRADTELTAARGHLPAATTPLIGRVEETSQVGELLGSSRLVTLTGMGGVGKTRLALHAARTLADRFERGVWWIDLTQLSSPVPGSEAMTAERVAGLVVTAMGLPDDNMTDGAMDLLARALGLRPVLLVLDNAEHIAAEAVTFTDQLLRRAPGARILATSRQALGSAEEQRLNVTTLSTMSVGEASEAARFFIGRARATDPSFDPDPAAVAAIEELCRRLDGLPLALELAASRIRGLSVRDLLERLSDRLNLLARPGSGVPPRQRTLRGTIDWSWSLLDDREQTVLRRLAVHPGSWSLAAIEEICAAGPSDPDPALSGSEVVDVLIGLVDRSLVATVGSPSGGLRYWLLESIGLYAAERLAEAGEREEVARRHLVYFRTLAEREDSRLRGPDQHEALARMEAERDHLDHAFGEALAADDGREAVAIAVAMFWYRWMTERRARLHHDLHAAITRPGPRDNAHATAVTLATCMRWFERSDGAATEIMSALDQFGDDVRARARAQWFAGANLMALGVRSPGEELIDSAIEVLQEYGEKWHVLAAVIQRDHFLVSQWAAPAKGLPDGGDLVDAARDLGDRQQESEALGVLRRVAENAADHERAAVLAEQSLEICLELGFDADASLCIACTAVAAIRRGDVAEAQGRVRRARDLADRVGDPFGRAYADYAEAIIARHDGELSRARALLDGWRTDAYIFQGEPGAQIEHAYLSIEEGDVDAAGQVLHDLVPLVTEGTRPRLTARWLELCTARHQSKGAVEDASWTLGVADAQRGRTHSPRDVIEDADVTRLRLRLTEHRGGARLDDRYRSGLSARPEDAIAAFP